MRWRTRAQQRECSMRAGSRGSGKHLGQRFGQTQPAVSLAQERRCRHRWSRPRRVKRRRRRAFLRLESGRVRAYKLCPSQRWVSYSFQPNRHWAEITVATFFNEIFGLKGWQCLLDGSRVAQSKSWLEARPGLKRRIAELEKQAKSFSDGGWRYLVSCDWVDTSESMISRTLGMETQSQLAVTALALERYRLRHGTFPQTLDALVPEFLSTVPVDCMDGRPLRYRLKPDGSFLLYAVGEDGKDDGGNPELRPDKKYFRQVWDGRDAVWPAPATPEEAVAALKNG